METIKEISEHIEEKADYIAKQITNITGKSIILFIKKDGDKITDFKLETQERWETNNETRK